ncbi:receptor-type tyrosine-protein phosphatase C isoform X2 [Cheilinus undulatus]|uniref:receptor-type tyrosine-protein phosphatase C isoform X2 n=1 Tax=Cheilinus undulatus TaxID=241271 RepID=UPI001BD56984|nr:receptor-type tyrosine-protein phosphatase C isoform X2 [Cheilinus undulatus]
MAGLFGLKILLLWAGIISLANCQGNPNASAPLPPHTTNTASTPLTSLPIYSSSPRTTTVAPVMSSSTPFTDPQTFTHPLLNSTTVSVTTPPADTLPSPKNPSSNKTTDPQTISTHNKTSPANESNTTVAPPETDSSSGPPKPPEPTAAPGPQCSYTVSTIKFGLQFHITSSIPGTSTINVTETAHPQIRKGKVVKHSSGTSSHELKFLKPCTEYKHAVVFSDGAGNETICDSPQNKTTERTSEMKAEDVKDGSCVMSGHVCYKSDWDIGSAFSPSNNVPAKQCSSDPQVFCIKPGSEDICTTLTTTFKSGNCDASFNRTKDISVEFLNENNINQSITTGFPAKIDAISAPNCKNLSVDYSCHEMGPFSYPRTLKLSELEPSKSYVCRGQIIYNNVNIKNTSVIHVYVDCDDLQTEIPRTVPDRRSVEMNLTTSSQSCNFTGDRKFSVICSCGKKQVQTTGDMCEVVGLDPFTDYVCQAQATYDQVKVGKPASGQLKTKSDTPDDVHTLSVSNPENNVIRVTCEHSGQFHGPGGKYIASLYQSSAFMIKKENKTSKCEFEFKDLSYLATYDVEVTAVNKDHYGNVKKKEVNTLYNDKAVIGFLIFLIILTSVALLLVVYKIFILKRRQSEDMSENIKLITAINDEENLMPVEPIAAELLLDAYKRKLADEGRLFLAEFQSIPRIFSRYAVKEAKKSCNSPKNRYVDILPYDHNRVQLTTGNGEAGCDYINASFIDGFKEPKKYIAAQGPKDETVGDFWRMVWEQQSSIIVMVTRCEEGNRVKCAQYWPSTVQEAEIFEEFIVKLNSEDNCPDYTIRRLSLINKRDKNSEREVTHIQFISWPDHGVPGEPHLLLKLRRRVNEFKNFFSGPIVVHCSAGVGRTGTYIGIDAMMECLDAEGRVDIYGYVVKLRRQRCLMVQVEAQYILIHQALLEHNQFGETEILLPELHSTLSTLKKKSPDNEPSLMEDEFERVPSFKNWRTFNTGITEENKGKNRSSSVIPYDYNRVLLKLDEGRSRDSEPDEDEEDESSDEEDEDSTKYINASHIDGYWGPRIFIAAQTPLQDTIADFWSMVYQKKASTIVMLSDCSEGEKEADCTYWDKDKKTFGEFEVEVVGTDITPTFTTRNMLLHYVKRKDSRPVKHFQFLKWGSKEVPEKAQDLTDMIKEIKHNCGSSISQRNNPIVVHCNNGSSRTGVFCALWNVLDSAETEKLVDIFQVAKTLRKERQGMLSSLEQYQFLYDALEGVFPVQNGDVKAAQASAADSVQIVNETKEAAAAEQPAEEKTKQPASTTNAGQQGAADSAPDVADGGKEDKKEESEKIPTETTPLEDSSNGPMVTVEV